jgi:hypothetical protein
VGPCLRTFLAGVAALAALVVLSGCGNRTATLTSADTEGPYLDAGNLLYQVQISRQLNPRDVEDRAYFAGVPKPESLRQDETWFAIFVRVKNPTGTFAYPARRFEIADTQGNRYGPVAVGADNVFAYRPDSISPAGVLPPPGSAAASGPVGGSMLLFRLTLATLANRPLVLHIFSPAGSPHEATVELDV